LEQKFNGWGKVLPLTTAPPTASAAAGGHRGHREESREQSREQRVESSKKLNGAMRFDSSPFARHSERSEEMGEGLNSSPSRSTLNEVKNWERLGEGRVYLDSTTPK
jgi:hypothetical protein